MSTTVRLVHELDTVDIKILIDQEGADYIATVMRAEYERTGDLGAIDIAKRIEATR